MYKVAKSSFKSATEKPLRIVVWNTSNEFIDAAKRVNDCFPLPPTPTKSAYPRSLLKIRLK